MASVYKKSRDKKKKGSCWYTDYTDENGKRRSVKGFTDKGETLRLGCKLEHEANLCRRGLLDPQIVRTAEKRRAPLAEHLLAYEASLRHNTPKHVKLTMARVRKIVDECEFKLISDIDREKVEACLADMQEEDDIGHRTYNHYVQAIDAFCHWMIETKRATSNPLLGLVRLNAATDVRHQRRALSPEEFAALVRSARTSTESIQCYTGEERARIYIISYMTGLRRKEIASLTPHSFSLDSTPPTITVQAACSKHRKLDVLPLHTEFVAVLRDWLKGHPEKALFPKLASRRTWFMVKRDLEGAGIPYQTVEGIADFHAAGRHSHITGLVRSGASLPEAQKLARHSDIKMTMKYTHIGMDDRVKAIELLGCQWIGSVSGVPESHSVTFAGTDGGVESAREKSENPCWDKGCDALCHSEAPGDSEEKKWRQQDTNRTISAWIGSLG